MAAVATVQSRALLALLIFSAGLLLILTALVEQPAGDHATEEHAFDWPFISDAMAAEETPADSHDSETPASDGHEDSSTGSTEDDHGTGVVADDTHESEATDHSETAGTVDEGRFLGLDLNQIGLAAPRATIVLIGLSVLLALLLAFKPGRASQIGAVVLGATGVVLSGIESFNAGEELGIFVPLPVLAGILYLGAVALAVLALLEAKQQPIQHE